MALKTGLTWRRVISLTGRYCLHIKEVFKTVEVGMSILNLEVRSRCISFVSVGYETMTVIRARACAKP